MRCHVYRSLRRADAYVYLAQRDDFDALPEALRAGLMPLHHVLELELDPGRRLAREDSAVVRANLLQCGFHLQAPPPRFAEFGASIRHD
jgi:uncharacterized protein YcgL (UPF0745 family)